MLNVGFYATKTICKWGRYRYLISAVHNKCGVMCLVLLISSGKLLVRWYVLKGETMLWLLARAYACPFRASWSPPTFCSYAVLNYLRMMPRCTRQTSYSSRKIKITDFFSFCKTIHYTILLLWYTLIFPTF